LELNKKLDTADSNEKFLPDGFLDVSRANCSLRTAIFSTYQDRGYTVIGTSNRTELETGFFLPFGDGISHIRPIVHLYKTQVRQIASFIGTRQEVQDQPASAGFWENENDIEDLSYWLCNGGPIIQQRYFDEKEQYIAEQIYSELTTEKIDIIISSIVDAGMENEQIKENIGVSTETIEKFRTLLKVAKEFKRKPYNISL
jgi:NAD+ synthase